MGGKSIFSISYYAICQDISTYKAGFPSLFWARRLPLFSAGNGEISLVLNRVGMWIFLYCFQLGWSDFPLFFSERQKASAALVKRLAPSLCCLS